MFLLRRVLITDKVDIGCVNILRQHGIEVKYKPQMLHGEILAEIANYEGLIVRSATKVTSEILEKGSPTLKIVGRAGTGVDNIDTEAATKHGVLVMNTPGGNTISAVEHTCAMILSLFREIPRATASLKAGEWKRSDFMGSEVMDKTLAIIGLGRIGREIARRLKAFGMKTIGYDPIIPAEETVKFGVESYPLTQLWPMADVITFHVPLLPETKHMMNEEIFEICKRGVRIINVSRGGVVDEIALLAALKNGQCGGAALDVYEKEPPTDDELLQHPKVICTPHLGANTHEAQVRVAMEIAQQFIDLSEGKETVGIVNKLN